MRSWLELVLPLLQPFVPEGPLPLRIAGLKKCESLIFGVSRLRPKRAEARDQSRPNR
jgi:hypothetical protein